MVNIRGFLDNKIVLKDNEWEEMNKNRLKKGDGYADKEMVEAFINGTIAWEQWQLQYKWIECDFENLIFNHEINLTNGSFNRSLFFAGAIFFKKLNCEAITFFEMIHFNGAIFKQEANFSRATFRNFAAFARAIFIKDANFFLVEFKRSIEFSGAKFLETANFAVAKIHEMANFSATEFKGSCVFAGSKFFDTSLFRKVKFSQPVNFEAIEFHKHANFTEATFMKACSFSESVFIDKVNFTQAVFIGDAFFKQSDFNKNAFFNLAIFFGNEIQFNQITLSSSSNLIFASTRFFHAVPDFRYLTKSIDIRFNNLVLIAPSELLSTTQKEFRKHIKNLSRETTPLLIIHYLRGYKKRQWRDDNEDKYRKLKELAIANHNHEYELKFNGYEMESKIINAANAVPFYHAIFSNLFFPVGLLSHALLSAIFFSIGKEFFNRLKKYKHRIFSIWASQFSIWRAEAKKQILGLPEIIFLKIYKCLSNFGQSIILPAFWLIVLAGVYYLRFFPSSFDLIKTIMPIPLFVNNFNNGGNIDELGFGVKSLATVLWFLLGLGIRNNFKIK